MSTSTQSSSSSGWVTMINEQYRNLASWHGPSTIRFDASYYHDRKDWYEAPFPTDEFWDTLPPRDAPLVTIQVNVQYPCPVDLILAVSEAVIKNSSGKIIAHICPINYKNEPISSKIVLEDIRHAYNNRPLPLIDISFVTIGSVAMYKSEISNMDDFLCFLKQHKGWQMFDYQPHYCNDYTDLPSEITNMIRYASDENLQKAMESMKELGYEECRYNFDSMYEYVPHEVSDWRHEAYLTVAEKMFRRSEHSVSSLEGGMRYYVFLFAAMVTFVA